MSNNTHSVVLKGKLYMGGGHASGDSQECTVMVYDIQSGEWSTLPKHQVKSFGMASVNNRLVLVGGLDPSTNKATSQLAVWESESQQWTFPYPPMDIARHSPAAATFNEWMAVAGGHGNHDYLNAVEILNTTEKRWYPAPPLPMAMGCDQMRSAVVGDEWYLTECFNQRLTETVKKVFTVSLPVLISCKENIISRPWHTLPSAPLIRSAPLAFQDSLFAVGGGINPGGSSSAIYRYVPSKKEWILVENAKLPAKRSWCTCIELSSEKFLVAGGVEQGGHSGVFYGVSSRRVDIATVMDS